MRIEYQHWHYVAGTVGVAFHWLYIKVWTIFTYELSNLAAGDGPPNYTTVCSVTSCKTLVSRILQLEQMLQRLKALERSCVERAACQPMSSTVPPRRHVASWQMSRRTPMHLYPLSHCWVWLSSVTTLWKRCVMLRYITLNITLSTRLLNDWQ